MATLASAPEPVVAGRQWTMLVRAVAITAMLGAAFLVVACIVLALDWPFSEKNVQKQLGTSFEGQVTFQNFQRVYWPHPGLIALGVTLRRSPDPGIPPLATVQRLVVTDRWTTVLTLQHRLRLVKMQGLRVVIPAAGTPSRAADFPPGNGKDFSGPDTFLEMVKIQDARLEVQGADGTFVLPVPSLTMEHVVKGHAAAFDTDVELQQPAATIHASGSIGPLHSTRLGEMPVVADFAVKELALADIGTLDGTVHATGKLSGRLGAIEVQGATQTDGFAVSGGTATTVLVNVAATVDGLNGDTVLRSIDAETGRTKVHVAGSVAGQPKTTKLTIAVEHGRLEDVMRPFVAAAPAMTGALTGTATATIVPAIKGVEFLNRLQMDAQFRIAGARMTDRAAEESLSAFSRRAQGTDPQARAAQPAAPQPGEPAVALTAASGPVTLRRGLAQAADLLVTLPGAEIQMGGAFDLKSETAHLTGNLTMKPDVSHVTTGVKAVLLKPLSPLFRHGKKPDQETVIPIQVTGTKTYKITGNFFGKK